MGTETSNETPESFEVAAIRAHVAFLTSEECEGRFGGSEGGHRAGDYLVAELRRYGLEPEFQEFRWEQTWGLLGTKAPDETIYPFRNILVTIPGSDPDLADETVLFSAHYDHIGREPGGERRIVPGANDNASGTSVLLEMARRLAAMPVKPSRTTVLAFWDGEELGLCGSSYYCRNPSRPLDETRFAVTLDMVGGLRENTLFVVGWRSGAGLREFLCRSNSGLFKNDVSGTSNGEPLNLGFLFPMWINSDHYPFYQKRIPSLLLFTGFEGPYHHPDDTKERLNYEGLGRVADVAMRFLVDAANAPPEKFPPFRSAEEVVPIMNFDEANAMAEEARATGGTRITPGMRSRENRLRNTPRRSTLGRGNRGRDAASDQEREVEQVSGLQRNSAEPGVLIVRELAEDDAFWKAGLRPNDRILTIDDRPATEVRLRVVDGTLHVEEIAEPSEGKMEKETEKKPGEDAKIGPVRSLEVETKGKIRLVPIGENTVYSGENMSVEPVRRYLSPDFSDGPKRHPGFDARIRQKRA